MELRQVPLDILIVDDEFDFRHAVLRRFAR